MAEEDNTMCVCVCVCVCVCLLLFFRTFGLIMMFASRLVILDTILPNIFLPRGKMIGMVRSRQSFILSSRSCEIGSPPTGGARRMNLSCVIPASVIRI